MSSVRNIAAVDNVSKDQFQTETTVSNNSQSIQNEVNTSQNSTPSITRQISRRIQIDDSTLEVQARAEYLAEFDPIIIALKILLGVIVISISSLSLYFSWKSFCSQPLQVYIIAYDSLYLIYIITIAFNYFNFRLRKNIKKVSAALKALSLCLQVIVQFWFFRTSLQSCNAQIQYSVLAMIILDYINFFAPVALFIICFCIPVLITYVFELSSIEGAQEKQIQNIQIRRYTFAEQQAAASSKEQASETMCVICYEYYLVGEDIRILPCSHEFHMRCVDRQLRLNKTCPLCRLDATKSLALSGNATEDDEESDNIETLGNNSREHSNSNNSRNHAFDEVSIELEVNDINHENENYPSNSSPSSRNSGLNAISGEYRRSSIYLHQNGDDDLYPSRKDIDEDDIEEDIFN